jgi:hypothetical protein
MPKPWATPRIWIAAKPRAVGDRVNAAAPIIRLRGQFENRADGVLRGIPSASGFFPDPAREPQRTAWGPQDLASATDKKPASCVMDL